ncbi:hypothetical protein HY501_03585 [Candidatus Woesearchaeota archaeon]|nr:hypothetical protein [Candidatus Woesearchaeota archaeon]
MGLVRKLVIGGFGLAGALGLWQLGTSDGSLGSCDLGRNAGRTAWYSGDKTEVFTEVFDDFGETLVDGNVLGIVGRVGALALLGAGTYGLYRAARQKSVSEIQQETKQLQEKIKELGYQEKIGRLKEEVATMEKRRK